MKDQTIKKYIRIELTRDFISDRIKGAINSGCNENKTASLKSIPQSKEDNFD